MIYSLCHTLIQMKYMNDYYKHIDKKVNEFIATMIDELNNTVKFKHPYDKSENLFRIQHNNPNFDAIEFKKKLGKNIKMIFFENNIFNISVSYYQDES